MPDKNGTEFIIDREDGTRTMRIKRDPEIKIAMRLMTQYKRLAAVNEALAAIQKQGGPKVHMVVDLGAKRHIGLAMDALSRYIEGVIKRHGSDEYLKNKTR